MFLPNHLSGENTLPTCCILFYSNHDNLKISAITNEFLTNGLWFQWSVQGLAPPPSAPPPPPPPHTDVNPHSALALTCASHRAVGSTGLCVLAVFFFLFKKIFHICSYLSVLWFPFPISLTASASTDSILKYPWSGGYSRLPLII